MARGEKGRERIQRADPVEPQFQRTGEAVATEGSGVRAGSSRPAYVDGASARPAKKGRWRLSNWRLRSKLLAVVLIPSLAAAVLGGLRVSDGVSEVVSLTKVGEEIDLQVPASKAIQEIQRERDLSVAYVAGRKAVDAGPLQQQRQRVDAAIRQFRGAVDASSAAVGQPYRKAARDLDVLSTVREAVDKTAYPGDDITRTYSDRVESLLDLTQQSISHIRNPSLLRLALATNALSVAQEAASLKRAQLNSVLFSGNFGPEQVRKLLSLEARLESAANDFRTWATPQQAQLYDDTVTGLQVDNARHIEEYALSLYSAGKPVVLNPNDWDGAASETVNLIARVQASLQNDLNKQHSDIATQANTDVVLASAATILALVLAFAIALMVARSLLLPLRILRRSALDVADRRLPAAVDSILHESNPDVASRVRIEPIPVHTTEEIGRVARSFDEVHDQALRLASEQALLRNNVNDLFVNLARRSQTLVQRQLSLIDRLEQDEQDPDQLSSLFELDHLATRMRRNNENLLILGGTDLTRRMMRPVPLSEVVGAAVSEVEQYARISVADTPELAIQGRVVNDLVHLVAELLENATVFSNPDTEVNIRSAYRRQELVVEIRDRGVGIDNTELAEINERLLSPPDVDVAVSRRMGLYVVGQLARRYNIRVHLHNNDDLEGGITATVRLSGEYVSQLTADGPVPMPDIQPSAEEQPRDQVTETGTHLGLAAAFGRGGVGDRGQDGTERVSLPAQDAGPQTEATQRSAIGQIPFGTKNVDGEDARSGNADAATAFTVLPGSDPIDDGQDYPDTQYSVSAAHSNAYGAADVPQWETPEEQAEAAWPQEESAPTAAEPPEAFDGQCGVPPSAANDASNLFQSPFESEKSAVPQPFSGRWDDWGSEFGATTTVQPTPEPAEPQQAPLGASRPAGHVDDAPTERLPIYEAVLSQWFRESDDADSTSSAASADPAKDVTASTGAAGNGVAVNGAAAVSPEPVEQPQEPEAEPEAESPRPFTHGGPKPVASMGTTAAGLPKRPSRTSRDQGKHQEDRPQKEQPQEQQARHEQSQESVPAETETIHIPSPLPLPKAEDPGWGSADFGWQAAEALVEQSNSSQETTAAGLPKRVPKSNLVPGSAAPKAPAAQRKPATPRSPDAVRGRMSNFQQGVRRGRHHKADSVPAEQSRSIPSRHEEQE